MYTELWHKALHKQRRMLTEPKTACADASKHALIMKSKIEAATYIYLQILQSKNRLKLMLK